MKAQGLARIGRDAEIRYLPNGDAVINLSLAFSYGKKGEDGNRPTQWVDGSMFGKRAETLAPYLLKGNQVVAYLDDIHIETYQGKNGEGHKLAGRINDIELTDRQRDAGQQQAPRQPAPQQQAPQRQQPQRPAQGGYQDARGGGAPRQAAPRQQAVPQGGGSGFDDFESDDIPFTTSSPYFDMTTSKSRRTRKADFS